MIERNSKTRKNNYQVIVINKLNKQSKSESIYSGIDEANALLDYLLRTE
jgi:hypothetical protein